MMRARLWALFARVASPVRSQCGQMTIEFVALFPIMLMIALVAFNSMLFLSECAAFDRLFRESVCVFAPSPESATTPAQTCARVEGELSSLSQKSYLSCSVSRSGGSDGLTTFSGTLFYTPSIFGAYPLHRIFDVELTPIQHSVQIVVDIYEPGVFL